MSRILRLQKSRKLYVYFLGMYIFIKPFYFWRSAIPQISDYILVVAICLYLLDRKFKIRFIQKDTKILFLACLFCLYVFSVNSIWNIILNNRIEVIRISLYYIYNCVALLIIIALLREITDLEVFIYRSIIISVYFQFFLFLFLIGFSGSRATAFFNNPNQLGYHGLLCSSLLMILVRRDKNSIVFFVGSILCCGFLIMVSLSKAAIISYFFGLACCLMLVRKKTKLIQRFILIYLIILIVIFISILPDELLNENIILNSVITRLSSIGVDSDDTLEGRGYSRIYSFAEYLFFGIGEGAYFRFSPPGEFHSTIGNIFLSYGLIGLVLFVFLLGSLFQHGKCIEVIWFISIMAYGFTHNGIRNTFFWVFLALTYVSNNHSSKNIRGDVRSK